MPAIIAPRSRKLTMEPSNSTPPAVPAMDTRPEEEAHGRRPPASGGSFLTIQEITFKAGQQVQDQRQDAHPGQHGQAELQEGALAHQGQDQEGGAAHQHDAVPQPSRPGVVRQLAVQVGPGRSRSRRISQTRGRR